MMEADEVLNALEKEYTSMGTWQQMSNQYMPSWMKSEKMQQMEQAQRNFVTAVLRQESGAAISASEFETEQKKYFPQPGDSQAVIEQKRKSRQTAIGNMMMNAGRDENGSSIRDIWQQQNKSKTTNVDSALTGFMQLLASKLP